MKTRLKLLCTTLFLVALTCGLSITASANETIPDTGLTVPTEYGLIKEGETVYTAGSGTVTITADTPAKTITFALNNATITSSSYGISSEGQFNDYDHIVTVTGTNSITTTGISARGISAVCASFQLSGSGDLTINAESGTSYGISVVSYGATTFSHTGKLTVNAAAVGIFLISQGNITFSDGNTTSVTAGGAGINLTGMDPVDAAVNGNVTVSSGENGLHASSTNLTVGANVKAESSQMYDIYLGADSGNTTLTINGTGYDAIGIGDSSSYEVTVTKAPSTDLLWAEMNSTTKEIIATIKGNVTLEGNIAALCTDVTKLYANKKAATLIIDAGATLTIPESATLYLDDGWDSTDNQTIFGTVTVNGFIQNNGTLYIGDDVNVTTGTDGNTIVGGAITMDDVTYVQGGDLSTAGFDFSDGLPAESSYYTAGEGYMLYNETANTITLHDTTFANSTDYIYFDAGDVTTIIVEGVNTLQALYSTSFGSLKSLENLTIQGTDTSDVLNISGQGSGGISVSSGTLTIQDCTVNLADNCGLSGNDGIDIDNAIVNITGADSTYTMYGIFSSSGNITITDSTVDVFATDYGIHSPTGSITIDGTGSTKVVMKGSAGYEGIKASTGLTIGGSVNLTVDAVSYGLRGSSVSIATSGDVDITTSADSGINSNSIGISGGATVAINQQVIENDGTLTVDSGSTLTATITNNGTLTIGDAAALGASTIDGDGKFYLKVDAPTEEMIVVPSNLTYTGELLTTTTSLNVTNANTTICGKTFTAQVDISNYTAKITYGSETDEATVQNAGTYTVTYSDGTNSVSKTFAVSPADMTDTTVATQTIILVGGSVALPTAPTATTIGENDITVKYSDDGGDTYTLDEMTFASTGEKTVYYQISAPNHNPITGTISVTVYALSFTGDMTADTTVTYGKTWADILQFANHTYVASEGDTTVAGAFTLKIDGATYTTTDVPNVKADDGTYSWAVTFTSTDKRYTDMAVDAGTVTINPVALTVEMISVGDAYTYTSEAMEPVTVANGSTDLVEDTDYTITYEDNTNAGTAKATVTGKGNYSNAVTKEFTIAQATLTIAGVSVDGKAYDGTKTATNPVISWSGKQGTDVITYTGSIGWYSDVAGTSTITYSLALTGASATNYNLINGIVQNTTPSNSATITTRAITITADNQTVTYGTAISQNTDEVTDTNSKLLTGHSISTVTLEQNSVNVTPVGEEALTITPSGVTIWDSSNTDVTANYDITYVDGTLTINAKTLADSMIADIADQEYTGSAITPAITVTDGDPSIITTDDYDVAYSDNINASTSTATVTITGKNNYTGTASKTFTIEQSGSTTTPVPTTGYTVVYGDTVNLVAEVEVVATNSLLRTASSANYVDFYLEAGDTDTYLGSALVNENGTAGTAAFSYNTNDRLLSIGVNTIYAVYNGSVNMVGSTSATTTVTMSAKSVTAVVTTDGITKEYDGTTATTVAWEVADGDIVKSGDAITVTATANYSDADAADGKTISFTNLATAGDQKDYYAVTLTTGITGNITAKDLTITTLAQEVEYGTAISSETTDVTVVGLIDGEALDSIVLIESDLNVVTESKTVKVDTAVIKNGSRTDVTENYDINYVETGVLTINAKSIVASWTGTTTEYNGSDQAPSVDFVGALEGDTIYTSMSSERDAGSYTVTLTGVDTNYTVSNPSTSFTISKAPITFTIGEDGTVSATDGYPADKYTVTYTDTAGNETAVVPTASGTYTVSVALDSNHRIAGQTGDEGTIGTYTVGATFYTVTFGDESTMSAQSGAQIIIPSGENKSATEVFAGWSYDSKTYKAGESFTQPSKDVTFEAVYSEVHDISGFVYAYDTTTGVEGVTITVVKGSAVYGTDVTDASGAYDFNNIPADVYNVVAAYDATTKTELADISSANADVNITLPQYNTSSVLEVAAGTPDIVVGGLDDVAASQQEGETPVKIALTVAQTSTTVAEIEEKTSNIAMYLDIDVSKTVDGTEDTGYNETSGLVEFIIPIPADYQGKASYTIYREHEGDIHEITTTANSDGEYLEVSADKTSLTLHVCKFSTYALAYTEYSTSSGTSTYSSSVASTDNGDVSISASKNKMNATVTITTDPDVGYEVGDVSVTYSSGKEVSVTDNGDGTYSYLQPGAAVTVTVTFVSTDEETDEDSLFTDVSDDAYYYDAVLWAVENGITSGYADDTFRPTTSCTRAQAVTFLWRTAGEPEATMDNPFSDLDETAYYYDAVLWAVENGITSGYDDGTFRPDTTCNRGAIVTFMYRLAGEPDVSGEALSDVADGAYYYDAVLWAVENGITTGYADGTFGPTTTCNRGAIVTFLYRYLA